MPIEHVVDSYTYLLRVLSADQLDRRIEIQPDVGRHSVVLHGQVEILLHPAGNGIIVHKASRRYRFPMAGLADEESAHAPPDSRTRQQHDRCRNVQHMPPVKLRRKDNSRVYARKSPVGLRQGIGDLPVCGSAPTLSNSLSQSGLQKVYHGADKCEVPIPSGCNFPRFGHFACSSDRTDSESFYSCDTL